MPLFGLDISHHQGTSLDLAQCRREGVEFIFLKATEGSSFVDSAFAANLSKARAAGMLVAAYHYVRSNATAAAQVANVARVVPRDVPVIPDVEANSGGIALVREFVDKLRAAGYMVPMTYLPRWYWQQIGSPSLVGLPSLWSSRYPDNVVGSLADEYNRAPASYWAGYGGLGVAVLQFTSSARVAGHAPLDGNAYLGAREQLAALLGGEEDDMALTDTFEVTKPDGTKFTTDYGSAIRNMYYLLFYGSGFEPWTGPGIAADLVAVRKAIAAQPDDVDEAVLGQQIAAQLAPMLPDLMSRLSDEDVQRIAAAATDEADRRARDGDPATGPNS